MIVDIFKAKFWTANISYCDSWMACMNIGMPNTTVVHICISGILRTGCVVTKVMQLLRGAVKINVSGFS